MAQGIIPADVLFKANLSRAQEQTLLESDALIDLAPLIEANMPNLSALLAAHPDWRAAITLDDGRIASLPLLNTTERQVCVWINAKWLSALNLSAPTSVAELTDVLLAFKASDPNGNFKQDEVAADLIGVYEMRWLLPYFGVVADDSNLARLPDGSLAFAPELPAYREWIATLRDWVAQGILPQTAFTAMHSTAALSAASSDEKTPVTSGLIVTMTPYTHVPSAAAADYDALLMPDASGATRWRDLLGEVWTGCFAVSSSCEDPAAALRWVDALYGEDGALLAYAGVEGEDYVWNADGTWSFNLDRQPDDQRRSRKRADVHRRGHARPLSQRFHIQGRPARSISMSSSRTSASTPSASRSSPRRALSLERQQRANELTAVLGGLVDRGVARFATGEIELNDETYAAWLSELKAAGGDELVAMYADN